MDTGSLKPLRKQLQAEIDKLRSSNDIALTGQIAASVEVIIRVLDEFDARLKALEKGIDDAGTY